MLTEKVKFQARLVCLDDLLNLKNRIFLRDYTMLGKLNLLCNPFTGIDYKQKNLLFRNIQVFHLFNGQSDTSAFHKTKVQQFGIFDILLLRWITQPLAFACKTGEAFLFAVLCKLFTWGAGSDESGCLRVCSNFVNPFLWILALPIIVPMLILLIPIVLDEVLQRVKLILSLFTTILLTPLTATVHGGALCIMGSSSPENSNCFSISDATTLNVDELKNKLNTCFVIGNLPTLDVKSN